MRIIKGQSSGEGVAINIPNQEETDRKMGMEKEKETKRKAIRNKGILQT